MTLQLRCAAVTDRGLVRRANQDAVYAGSRLLAVADGMGGMAAGDLASAIVIEAIGPLDADHRRRAAGRRAAGGDRGRQRPDQGRGCRGPHPRRDGHHPHRRALLGHRHRDRARARRRLARLPRARRRAAADDQGRHVRPDARRRGRDHRRPGEQPSPARGGHPGAAGRPGRARVQHDDAQAGDRWLLCSDGLSNVVREETIAEVLAGSPERTDAAHRLVDLARRAGGPDNITVVVADIVDDAE